MESIATIKVRNAQELMNAVRDLVSFSGIDARDMYLTVVETQKDETKVRLVEETLTDASKAYHIAVIG